MGILSKDQIGELTPAQRLELIGELWDSLGEDQVDVAPEDWAEIERRLTAVPSEASTAKSWTEVRSRLEKRET